MPTQSGPSAGPWHYVGFGSLTPGSGITALSAAGPNSAYALAYQNSSEESGPDPVFLRWNGDSWSRLAGISGCFRPLALDALGAAGPTAVCNGTLYALTGNAWHAQPSTGMAGIWAQSLVTVGGTTWLGGYTSTGSKSYDQDTALARYNETTKSWTASSFGAGEIDSIGGSSATDVWAVGEKQGKHPVDGTPIIGHYNGVSWSASPIPAFHGIVNGVFASSRSSAWAVGTEVEPNEADVPAVLHWDGASWHRVEVPLATGPEVAVVGTPDGQVWVDGTSLQHFDGVSWSVWAIPAPSNRYGWINSMTTVPGTSRLMAGGANADCDEDENCQQAFVLMT